MNSIRKNNPKENTTESMIPTTISEPVNIVHEVVDSNLKEIEDCNQESNREQRAIEQVYKIITECNKLKIFNPKNNKMKKPTAQYNKSQGVTLYYTLPTNIHYVQVEFKHSKKIIEPVYTVFLDNQISRSSLVRKRNSRLRNTSHKSSSASQGDSDDRRYALLIHP